MGMRKGFVIFSKDGAAASGKSYSYSSTATRQFSPRPATLPRRSESPDVDALGGREVELVSGLHIEGLVPSVDVADHAVHAEFRRAVDVRQDLVAQRFFALERAEGLGPAQEKPLITREALQHRGV